MKRWRNSFKILLCLFAVVTLIAGTVNAAAVDKKDAAATKENLAYIPDEGRGSTLQIQKAAVDNNGALKMTVFSDGTVPDKDDLQLDIDGQEISVDNVRTYSGRTLWLFLVDTSTVGTDKNEEPVKDTLRALINSMRSSDMGAVIKTGNTSRSIGLNDRAYLQNHINEIYNDLHLNPDVSNLYETIGNALDFMEGEAEETERTVLAIISNGQADKVTNMSHGELIERIGNGSTTIYSVAYRHPENKNIRLSDFEALATSSKGGTAIEEEYNGNSEGVLSLITENEKKFLLVSANPASSLSNKYTNEELQQFGKTVTLRRGIDIEASLDLSDEQMQRIVAKTEAASDTTEEPELTATPEPTAAPEDETASEQADAKDTAKDEDSAEDSAEEESIIEKYGIFIIAGAAVLLLLIVLLLIFKGRKKEVEPAPESMPLPGQDYDPDAETVHLERKEPRSEYHREESVREPAKGETEIDESLYERHIKVVLTATDGSNKTYEGDLSENGELSIGRKDVYSEAQMLIDNGDGKMSRKHVVLRYKDGKMTVYDFSKNGTWINKRKVVGAAEVHQGDELTLARSPFRIIWMI